MKRKSKAETTKGFDVTSEDTEEKLNAYRFKLWSDFVPVVEQLFEQAKGGDVGAANGLVEGAEIMARFVECLFNSSPESREMIQKIASEKGHWPSIASPFNEEYGPDWTREHLEQLKVGTALNRSPRKRDDRTEGETVAIVHLMRLAEQRGETLTRAGMKSRNQWIKSSHGKAAGKAVKYGLRMLYEEETWLDCPILLPLVTKARKVAEEADRYRNGRMRNEPAKATTTAIKSAFFKEALSLIHGRLGD